MKKFAALFLSALMLLSCAVVGVSAAAWDGFSAEAFAGSGTEADPYVIDTAAKLAKLAAAVNAGESYAGKYFVQTADIDLGSKEWTPIGAEAAAPFSGVYNGKGHTVSGLSITKEANMLGLFGNIYATADNEAGAANLTVAGTISYTGGEIAAPLVGGICGGANANVGADKKGKNVIFENIVSNVNITINETAQQPRVGGLFGQIYCAVVENCVNNGKINSTGTNVMRLGGLCGQENRVTFRNCVNNGDVTGAASNAKSVNAAGFASYITVAASDETWSVYENCVNNGTITATVAGAASSYAAGFCANAYATTGTPLWAKLVNCLNNGKIISKEGGTTGYPYAGGIAGIAQPYEKFYIENCVNTADTASFVSEGGAGARAGGIIGAAWQEAHDMYVKNTISAGNTCPAYKSPATDADKATWTENDAAGAKAAADRITAAVKASTLKINGIDVNKADAPAVVTEPAVTQPQVTPEVTEPASTTKPANPTTGDNGAVALYVVLAVAAAAGISAVVIGRRKEEN